MSYKLPNKNNVVVDDINTLSNTFHVIDEDITRLSEKTSTIPLSDIDGVLRCGLANPEIKNIAPSRFITIDDSGTGVTCVDGGGAAGGLTGQCCVKRTNRDFDIVYGDILEISEGGTLPQTTTNGESQQIHIIGENSELDNGKELPHKNVINQCIISNYEANSNESVCLVDTFESAEETQNIATKLNYGIVKIGNGVIDNQGEISAKEVKTCAKNRFGTLQVGSNLNVDTGTISTSNNLADFENFGLVKLNSDFVINEQQEMELVMADTPVIYKLNQSKPVENGVIELEETSIIYRAVISEDIILSIHSNFTAIRDFTFILEIVSDGVHLVNFSDPITPIGQTTPVNRGLTRFKITKKIGLSTYEVEMSNLYARDPVCLTPAYSNMINNNFIMTNPNGGGNRPDTLLRTKYEDYQWIREVQFKFEKLVCVDYVKYVPYDTKVALPHFRVKASNDAKNWVVLIDKYNEIVSGNIYTDTKGCFRYYNVLFDYSTKDNAPAGITLWGTEVDNNESELTLVTPYMNSNITTFATFTGSNVTEGGATQLTDNDSESKINNEPDSEGKRWVQYELTEPAVANILEIDFCETGGYSGHRQTNWFKLFGSNDVSNWTLLLERQYYQAELYKNRLFCFWDFENETKYKYYRLECIATNSSDNVWCLMTFKLYHRTQGRHNFEKIMPYLSSTSQEGYEISASSHGLDNEVVLNAFDGKKDSLWFAGHDSTPSWVKVKMPATVCNAVQLSARNDQYYNYSPKDFTIQGSINDADWDVLSTQTNMKWGQGETKLFNFENETPYTYYKLDITASNESGAGLSEIDFGRIRYDYKRLLNKYDYIVPILTGANTETEEGTYKLTSSPYDSYGNPWGLFDRNPDTMIEIDGNCWVILELPYAKAINYATMSTRNDSYYGDAPRDYKLSGSNNGNQWHELFSGVNTPIWTKGEIRKFEITDNTPYKFFKLEFGNAGARQNCCSITGLNLINHCKIQEY